MNHPINFIDNDKVEIFNQLHAHQVRYLAFGSFSINAYEQARTDSTIKLWVDPAPDNMDRLNKALHESGQKPLTTDFNPESRRALKTSRVESQRDIRGKISTEHRYYLSDLLLTPWEFNQAVSSHRGIENQLHWMMDVVFLEDVQRTKTENAP
ncbi:hypothetical protein [Telluribacter sp.]|jgi:predicted transposase YbfD/YdcC|uniref:hypothetical protein n=1 Tax=Telluribacter sp. TaxID=1978767 RepID=UPI002E146B0C|nr:hypothetical protein [Telluribacter sp.]